VTVDINFHSNLIHFLIYCIIPDQFGWYKLITFNGKQNMTSFFERRSKLGLAVDVATGSVSGFKLGVFGSLAPMLAADYSSNIALAAVGASPILALAGACDLGGAIAILPIIYLREATRNLLGINNNSHNQDFMLKAATNVSFNALFAVSSAAFGAAILGLALTPVVTTALAGAFVLEILKAIHSSLYFLSNAVANIDESCYDRVQSLLI